MAYGMKLTTIGAAKLLAAATDETEITFAKVVWGNANGVAYEPTGEEPALVNQIHSTNVLAVDIDPERPNVYRVDGELTSAPSEFTLLEVGILDEDDDLIAVGNHPPQFVPGPSSTFTLNYHPSWFLVISPELAVAVTLAPPGDFATEEWVTANFQPKGTYVKTVEGQDGVTVTGSAADRVAKADKSWFDARYKAIDADAPGVNSVTRGNDYIAITGTAADPKVGANLAKFDERYRGISDPFPLPAHTHPSATQSVAGFMSATDKIKLDGLDGVAGGGLFTKIAETVVSSSRQYIDVLNIAGGPLLMLRMVGLRTSPELPSGKSPLYVQFGNNSTLYATAGDYYDTGIPHFEINKSPAISVSSGVNGFGSGLLGGTSGQRQGFFALLRGLNSPAVKTQMIDMPTTLNSILTIDDDGSPAGTFYGEIRRAATAENRIRVFTVTGYQFIAGRVQVYAIGA